MARANLVKKPSNKSDGRKNRDELDRQGRRAFAGG
jgi:hypothetical protein